MVASFSIHCKSVNAMGFAPNAGVSHVVPPVVWRASKPFFHVAYDPASMYSHAKGRQAHLGRSTCAKADARYKNITSFLLFRKYSIGSACCPR